MYLKAKKQYQRQRYYKLIEGQLIKKMEYLLMCKYPMKSIKTCEGETDRVSKQIIIIAGSLTPFLTDKMNWVIKWRHKILVSYSRKIVSVSPSILIVYTLFQGIDIISGGTTLCFPSKKNKWERDMSCSLHIMARSHSLISALISSVRIQSHGHSQIHNRIGYAVLFCVTKCPSRSLG